MASVCAFIDCGTTAQGADPAAPLRDYIRSLGTDHPAFSLASEFLSDGGTTAGKNVLSTIKASMRIFSHEGIRWMTATSTCTMDELIEGKTAIYLHILGDGHVYNPIFTIWFNQYWRAACKAVSRNGGELPRQTVILGDEWGNLPRVSALSEMVTLGRSYGLHVYLFVQNLKQLNKYNDPGDNGAGQEKITGSIGIQVALSLGTEYDRKYFTGLCGKRTVRTRGDSEQRRSGDRSASYSMNETAVDLVKEWDWKDMVPARDGAIVVKSAENNASGHSGTFRMPLCDATRTPAKDFFGLGSRQFEGQKKIDYERRLDERAQTADGAVSVWCPDFWKTDSVATRQGAITDDESLAWD